MNSTIRCFVFSISCPFFFYTAAAQSKADKKAVKQLKVDIGYLASDELEGRRTGSAGERKAGDYIIHAYETARIPAFRGQYRYIFHFTYGREIGAATVLKLNGALLPAGKDAFPMPFSASKSATADVLQDVPEEGNMWLMPLYQSEEDANDPHFDWEKYAYNKSKEAAQQGAAGVIFYDGYGSKYAPEFNGRSEYESLDIPVVYVGFNHFKTYIQPSKGSVQADINVALQKTDRTGTNIAAYIDNKAAYTVILGAHYDHLGYGEDGSSLYTGKEKKIHNGADDNASGTAALIQLAQWIKKGKLKKYNYLFVHFSGEELGLLGSKAFIKEQGIDSMHTAYMINMDMVGRLNDSTHVLTVGGVGTSPVWAAAVDKNNAPFRLSIDSSGVGPSDHTSFYYAGIPVLFFFTGTHSDYHKPSDVADKINYPGEVAVMRYIYKIVQKTGDGVKPAFTATKQTTVGKVRFKVTLGIMPDYSYQDEGVRIDGISEGKTADKAGLKAGDIIIQLGDTKVKGMQSYMEGLAKFKEGDKAKVIVRRGKKEMTFPVQFK
ncbi:M28 family peptidase [Chitinophagaceae bacterium MMS25-I14]